MRACEARTTSAPHPATAARWRHEHGHLLVAARGPAGGEHDRADRDRLGVPRRSRRGQWPVVGLAGGGSQRRQTQTIISPLHPGRAGEAA